MLTRILITWLHSSIIWSGVSQQHGYTCLYVKDLLLQVNQLSLWAVKSNTYFSYVNSIIMLHKPSDWYTILVSSHIAKYITEHCSILKCSILLNVLEGLDFFNKWQWQFLEYNSLINSLPKWHQILYCQIKLLLWLILFLTPLTSNFNWQAFQLS